MAHFILACVTALPCDDRMDEYIRVQNNSLRREHYLHELVGKPVSMNLLSWSNGANLLAMLLLENSE